MQITKIVLFLFLFLLSHILRAQKDYGWDNQVYLGNKVAFGKNQWRFSGELQTRLKDNFHSLDNWYLEFVSNYLFSEKIEIVPDLRYTTKPDKLEIRPGIGILYKNKIFNTSYINQIKYQIDIPTKGDIGHAFRDVMFFNHVFNKNLIGTAIVGFIYRWRPNWNGFQYVRVGPGVTYVFDNQHRLSFNYFIGVENKTDGWLWSGIPVIQLVINVSKQDEYKYAPAYYFDF